MKTIIGVMGGAAAAPATLALATELGAAIARAGWVTLCGGRNAGVMAAVAAGARAAGGLTVGVLPAAGVADMAPAVDIPIVTGMGDARNVINVLSSQVVVALAGGAGTLSEVALALKAGRPLVLLDFPAALALVHAAATPWQAVETVPAALAAIHSLLTPS